MVLNDRPKRKKFYSFFVFIVFIAFGSVMGSYQPKKLFSSKQFSTLLVKFQGQLKPFCEQTITVLLLLPNVFFKSNIELPRQA